MLAVAGQGLSVHALLGRMVTGKQEWWKGRGEGWEAEARTCIPASQRANKKHSQWPGRCRMSPDKLYETQNNALEGGTERRSCQWLLSSFPYPFIKMKAVGVNPLFFWVGSPGLFRQQTSFGEADPLTSGGGIYGIKEGEEVKTTQSSVSPAWSVNRFAIM